jgi:hypothetical protein
MSEQADNDTDFAFGVLQRGAVINYREQ